MRFYVRNMTEDQLDEDRAAIEKNPDFITVVDQNGNTNCIKTEIIDKEHEIT